jgi:hypothetical protein
MFSVFTDAENKEGETKKIISFLGLSVPSG